MQRSIVVTGLGLVTSIGSGREAFWHNLLLGRSGIGPVQAFDTSAYRGGTQGAEVKAFRAADYLVRLNPANMGRASQFATAAARLAIADAQLDVSTLDPERAGVSMGTTSGEPND
jgi:3-oxoacyl-[acyl-carrier-protein] synthase II